MKVNLKYLSVALSALFLLASCSTSNPFRAPVFYDGAGDARRLKVRTTDDSANSVDHKSIAAIKPNAVSSWDMNPNNGRRRHIPEVADFDLNSTDPKKSDKPKKISLNDLSKKTAPVATTQRTNSKAAKPSNTSYYIIQSGDTIYSISRAHNMTPSGLRKLNDITHNNIYTKRKLLVYGTAVVHKKRISPPKPTKPKSKSKPKPKQHIAKKYDWYSPIDHCTTVKNANKHGVLLKCKAGNKIRAMASGVVIFAGNELKNYGNMVLIEHKNKVISAYAHLGSISVAEDQKVTSRQKIGVVGINNTPVLFQIHKQNKYVDPRKFINLE